LVSSDCPSAESNFGNLKVGRSELTEFQCSGAAAAAGFAGAGFMRPDSYREVLFCDIGPGADGLAGGIDGTSGVPLSSFSHVILKSSRDMNISSNSLV